MEVQKWNNEKNVTEDIGIEGLWIFPFRYAPAEEAGETESGEISKSEEKFI
jgi:hypothetical protein